MRYTNGEIAMSGDLIRSKRGRLGKVTMVRPAPDLERITIRWDEGIIEINYPLAKTFTLISRPIEICKPNPQSDSLWSKRMMQMYN
jgi:hypothetical protein